MFGAYRTLYPQYIPASSLGVEEETTWCGMSENWNSELWTQVANNNINWIEQFQWQYFRFADSFLEAFASLVVLLKHHVSKFDKFEKLGMF